MQPLGLLRGHCAEFAGPDVLAVAEFSTLNMFLASREMLTFAVFQAFLTAGTVREMAPKDEI